MSYVSNQFFSIEDICDDEREYERLLESEDLNDYDYQQIVAERNYDDYEAAQLQRLDEIHDGDWEV